MRVDIFTTVPGYFTSPLSQSLLGKAIQRGILEVHVHDLHRWGDRHGKVDDYPFGGGPGMVIRAEPFFRAVEEVVGGEACPIILLDPAGERFTQEKAWSLARHPRMALLCGRYEGVDERVREHLATEAISIGDYVLQGGEAAALVVLEAVARLVEGVVGEPESLKEESFTTGLLEYPHYTRPAVFRGWGVPDVLLSGNHRAIARWRRERSLERTFRLRPDLLERAELDPEDVAFLSSLGWKGRGGASGAGG